jgi:hypothetical protein
VVKEQRGKDVPERVYEHSLYEQKLNYITCVVSERWSRVGRCSSTVQPSLRASLLPAARRAGRASPRPRRLPGFPARSCIAHGARRPGRHVWSAGTNSSKKQSPSATAGLKWSLSSCHGARSTWINSLPRWPVIRLSMSPLPQSSGDATCGTRAPLKSLTPTLLARLRLPWSSSFRRRSSTTRSMGRSMVFRRTRLQRHLLPAYLLPGGRARPLAGGPGTLVLGRLPQHRPKAHSDGRERDRPCRLRGPGHGYRALYFLDLLERRHLLQ